MRFEAMGEKGVGRVQDALTGGISGRQLGARLSNCW